MRPNEKNSTEGKIQAFEDYLDGIYWEGYAQYLKEGDREAYDFFYAEFAEAHSLAS